MIHSILSLSIGSFVQFPRLYFALVLFFLVPFSCFIAVQVYQLVGSEIYFSRVKRKFMFIHTGTELLDFLSVLLKKNLWFDAIRLMEIKYSLKDIRVHQYFNSLGFIYYNMQKYDLAKLYYIKALKIQDSYIVGLQNLAKVYEATKDNALMMSTYQSILKLDPTNKIASQYFKMLPDYHP